MDSDQRSARLERFLEHVRPLGGGGEPQLWPITSNRAKVDVTAVGFVNQSDRSVTGFTYGLSGAQHSAWIESRPELSISVQSDDPKWALSIGYLAAQLAGECPFQIGDTMGFGGPISAESAMDGFVVLESNVAGADTVDLGADVPVRIVGLYPTYASERAYIVEHGLAQFCAEFSWDVRDVSRQAVV